MAPESSGDHGLGFTDCRVDPSVVPVLELERSSDQPRRTSPALSETAVVARLQEEIDSYYEEMAGFSALDLGDIFMKLAAISARASGVRTQIVRSESRRVAAFRTRELDPLIDECDRQFKIWSRLQSVRQQEWEISKGGT